jgi:hypothetical protein
MRPTRSYKSLRLYAIAVWLVFTLHAPAAPISQFLREPIAAAIRWQAYWQGVEALGDYYRPGAQIEVRVLQTQGHLHAFLAPLRMGVEFTTGPPDFRVRKVVITGSAAPTNTEAVASFLRMRGLASAGCSGKVQQGPRSPAKNGSGRILPLGRPCPEQEAILGDETMLFVLPELTPPDSIQRKSVPAGKEVLAAQVQKEIKLQSEACGATTARIPFYSDTDPSVYVFIEHAGECRSGVATYSRAVDGRWEFGKFFADVPKEQLSGVIAKVKANTAITVKP